jgi:hypothetical protein
MFASVGSCLGTFPVATREAREEAQLVAPVRDARIVPSGQQHIGGQDTGTPPEIEKNDAHRDGVGRQRTFSMSRLRATGD